MLSRLLSLLWVQLTLNPQWSNKQCWEVSKEILCHILKNLAKFIFQKIIFWKILILLLHSSWLNLNTFLIFFSLFVSFAIHCRCFFHNVFTNQEILIIWILSTLSCCWWWFKCWITSILWIVIVSIPPTHFVCMLNLIKEIFSYLIIIIYHCTVNFWRLNSFQKLTDFHMYCNHQELVWLLWLSYFLLLL